MGYALLLPKKNCIISPVREAVKPDSYMLSQQHYGHHSVSIIVPEPYSITIDAKLPAWPSTNHITLVKPLITRVFT